ncbi:DUF4270 family protein [Chryseolinea sp. T2]|uniref:DUF4270 family protein n=1 Tax=Chryseolinea sp. T2 TaxID=3129255 RepID=UPI0030768EBB
MKKIQFIPVLVCLSLLAECVNDPNTLGLSNSTFSSDYDVVVVDTVTVRVSTVLLDSFPTSNTGVLLVGGYNDAKLGRMQGEGYMQIGTGNTWTPPADAIFDSLVLIAHYSGYTYGDTTVAHNIEVRRVTQPFQVYSMPQFWINEGQYSALYTANSKFNGSAMRYSAQPIGSKKVRIRAHSSDSLMVRINDDLGREWLRLTKENSPDLIEDSRFSEYFKGICMGTDGTDESVIGIKTENIKIRLYYKTYVGEQLTQQYHDYTFTTNLFNYSRFTADRSQTSLNTLSLAADEVTSVKTDDMAFVQSGTGLVTKVTFPYLFRLLRLTDVLLVNQALLVIEPVKDSYNDQHPLPSSLTLYHTDKRNLPLQRVYANYNTNAYQSATISFDEEFDKSTGYQFVVTQLAQQLLSTDGSTDRGLLIMPDASQLNTTVNRAYFGAGGDYRIKLKIWYTKLQ